ncbi:hypothetical protein RJZ56_001090 [Blastomyces dermatitidis]
MPGKLRPDHSDQTFKRDMPRVNEMKSPRELEKNKPRAGVPALLMSMPLAKDNQRINFEGYRAPSRIQLFRKEVRNSWAFGYSHLYDTRFSDSSISPAG